MKPIDQFSDAEFEHLVRCAVALPDAPAQWVRSAQALFEARRPLAQVADAAVALVRAVLSFDSWAPGRPAAGVRSLPSPSRHMVFSAMGRDIDLRILPMGGQFVLAGQVLGPDEPGRLELVAEPSQERDDGGDADARWTTLDALGEFRLADVAPGRYLMTLHLAGERLLLPPIDVGASRP